MIAARREILLGGAALGAVTAFPSKLAAYSELTALQKFIRIRCSEVGRRTFWWYNGQLLGRVGDTALRPLFSIAGVSQTIGTWREDGSLGYEMVEAGYYGDPETGEIADAPIVNPLTGELVKVEHYLSPQKLTFTPDLKVLPSQPVPPEVGKFQGTITPPDNKGDRIWMAERLLGQLYPTAARGARVFNSLANFEASVAEVERDAGFVPATMQYTTFNSFRPWMNMGDAHGNISSRLNALKLDSWQDVPADLRARVEGDHPGVFSDA